MVKLGRHGGALLTGFVFAIVLGSQSATAQSLPSGWASRDVGSPAMPGSSQSSSGIYTVQGAGTDIGGTSDQFQYCYRSISGDVDIRVRVAAMQDTSAGSKFGLMIRDSMNANARNVFVLLSAEQQVALQWRTKAGRTTGKVTGATAATPVWIRLVRQGNTFRGYSSPTGSTWTQIGSTNFRMSSSAYVGLAVTSHNAYQPATGTFSGLAMGNSAPLVPAPWTAKDIGSPAIAGAATESGGTFTVSGAGTDIFNSSDQFQFVYQPVSGDTQIVARVASLQAANSWSKAGVMIRADLTGSAANAAMFATASGSWVAQERLLAGGTTYQAAGAAGAAPGWVKVVREGDVLSAFESPDGNTWTLVDTDTIPDAVDGLRGLAVTSHASTAVATATFTNVAVSVPASSNNPPTVSITAPASGASYTAPGKHHHFGDGRRFRRLRGSRRFLPGLDADRVRHDEPVQCRVEQCRRRHLQPDRRCDRQCRRHDDVDAGERHRQLVQQATDRLDLHPEFRRAAILRRQTSRFLRRRPTRMEPWLESISTRARRLSGPTRRAHTVSRGAMSRRAPTA